MTESGGKLKVEQIDENVDLDACDEQAQDRRAQPRAMAIFRPALIETDDFAGFCLIRNLSDSGLMAKVYAQFTEGEPVRISFNSDIITDGVIVWSKDGQIGIKFDTGIDVDDLLQKLSQSHTAGKVNRAPRLQVECEGELLSGKHRIPMRLQDISQRGIKVNVSSVWPGDEVFVQLDGLEQRKAVVRWTQGRVAGLNFVRPVGFEELAEWVIEKQSG